MKKNIVALMSICILALGSCTNGSTSTSGDSPIISTQEESSTEYSSSEEELSSQEISSSEEMSSEEGSSSEVSSSEIDSSVISSEESSSEEISSTDPVVEVESISLNYTEYTLEITPSVPNPTVELVASVLPDDATDPSVSWYSTDTTVATVIEGTVTAVGIGETVIRAVSGTKSASCTITVQQGLPSEIVDATYSDFAEEEKNTSLYRITGIVEDIYTGSDLGNFTLTNKDANGESLKVYGLGKEEDAPSRFSVSDEGIISYSIPQEFSELGIQEGYEITIVGVYYNTYGEYRFSGYLEDFNDGSQYSYPVTVSYNDEIFGSITLSNDKPAHGEIVIITPVPAEGYKVSSISYNSNVISPTEEGIYSFVAKVNNAVTVSFIQDVKEEINYEFGAIESSIDDPSGDDWATQQNDASAAAQWNSSGYLRLPADSTGNQNGSAFITTSPVSGSVESVTITMYAQRASGEVKVFASSDAEFADSEVISTISLEGNGSSAIADYIVGDVPEEARYIKIQNTCSAWNNQIRITNIRITLK